MGRDTSDELTGSMPIVPHGTAPGVECCGCIVAVVEDQSVELRCNECGAVVGVIQIDILRGLFGLDAAKVTWPHCGKLNTFLWILQDVDLQLPSLRESGGGYGCR